MYLATVTAIEQVGAGETAGASPRMEATLKVDRVLKGAATPAAPDAVVRYEQAERTADDTPSGVSYRMAVGDRALVFSASFAKGFPIEMVVGPPKAVAAEVAALRAYLAAMDDPTARLHGVTPVIRARQTALYDRVLADLPGAPTP